VFQQTESGLVELGCAAYSSGLQLSLTTGSTYLIQFGSIYGTRSDFRLNIQLPPPPANDDFANAIEVSGVTSGISADLQYASLQDGEPDPGLDCSPYYWECKQLIRTVWYSFTTPTDGSFLVTAEYVKIFTGEWGSLTPIASWPRSSGSYSNSGWVFHAQPGTTYYLQVADESSIWFDIQVTPPVTIYGIGYENDAGSSSINIYDTVYFYPSYVNDPMNIPVTNYEWDFGDGTIVETAEYLAPHHYSADNLEGYPVRLKITTADGRTVETSGPIPVITRNVTITKFTLPDNVRAGQTRPVYVYVANPSKYIETVKVIIYRSTPGGYVKFGELTQQVVVTPLNQPVRFAFSYTFTKEDATVGKVTFKAVATIMGSTYEYEYEKRDALPADNTAISVPVRVR